MIDINPKDLFGKKPEQQPYKSKIPQELKPVKDEKKPQIELNVSDYWNRFWGTISDVATKAYTFVENLSQLKNTLIFFIIAIVLGIILVLVVK